MSAELRVNPDPCRACGGKTHFMARYVDDQGVVSDFHDTCVGSWLSRFPQRTLRFFMAERGTPIDLMEALKRSLAAIQPAENYTGPKLVIEDEEPFTTAPLQPFRGLEFEE